MCMKIYYGNNTYTLENQHGPMVFFSQAQGLKFLIEHNLPAERVDFYHLGD